jgi:hypothetical protein
MSSTEEDALRAMDAELEFAFGERRSAEDWVLPSDLRRTMERNPSLDIKPDRMAYSPLLVPIEDRKYIPEPLHTELRTLAALYDTRYLVVPVRLTVEAESTDAARSGAEVAYAGGDAIAPASRAYMLAAGWESSRVIRAPRIRDRCWRRWPTGWPRSWRREAAQGSLPRGVPGRGAGRRGGV